MSKRHRHYRAYRGALHGPIGLPRASSGPRPALGASAPPKRLTEVPR